MEKIMNLREANSALQSKVAMAIQHLNELRREIGSLEYGEICKYFAFNDDVELIENDVAFIADFAKLAARIKQRL